MSNPPSSPDGNTALSVARLTVLGTITAAVIAGLVAIVVAVITKNADAKDPTPTASATVPESPSCARAVIAFTEPAATAGSIDPGTDVHFRGTITCLAPGHDLWLASRISPTSMIYIATTGPVASVDGDWEADVFKLGDSSDAGGSRTFFGLDANEKCSEALSALKDKRPRAVAALPSGCVRLKPEALVEFRKNK